MEAVSTSRRPLPWSASGPKMAMKLVALGQSVENCRDWLAPSDSGKTSATIRARGGQGLGAARPGRRR